MKKKNYKFKLIIKIACNTLLCSTLTGVLFTGCPAKFGKPTTKQICCLTNFVRLCGRSFKAPNKTLHPAVCRTHLHKMTSDIADPDEQFDLKGTIFSVIHHLLFLWRHRRSFCHRVQPFLQLNSDRTFIVGLTNIRHIAALLIHVRERLVLTKDIFLSISQQNW